MRKSLNEKGDRFLKVFLKIGGQLILRRRGDIAAVSSDRERVALRRQREKVQEGETGREAVSMQDR